MLDIFAVSHFPLVQLIADIVHGVEEMVLSIYPLYKCTTLLYVAIQCGGDGIIHLKRRHV